MSTSGNSGTAIKYPDERESARWWRQEDWWSIILSLVLIAAAFILFSQGGSLKWLATGPAKWTTLSEAGTDLLNRLPALLGLYIVWALLLTLSSAVIGHSAKKFLGGFTVLFIVAVFIFQLGAWASASRYNLEPPLLALVLGLVVSNIWQIPDWLARSLRVEYFIKIGIVLLGATLPLTLIQWAGPVAIGQATIVSLVTFLVIFITARLLGLENRFAAVLGVGGAVCGVSAAIAVAGAVRARREQASVAISLVIIWAIISLLVLPFVARSLGLSTGVAGAWIGTSEFADAAGIAAAQTYSDLAAHSGGAIAGKPEAAVQAFTLMKVIGRDIWIGIWAFVLAIVATTWWRNEGEGVSARAGAGEIWRRFPKFVIGFVLASLFVTWLSSHYTLAEYRSTVTPAFIAPITALRTWAFIFCFLSIGLSTRFSTLTTTGLRPFWAFTVGVIVNVILGYILSVHVFADFWNQLGNL
ncbi:YeiH family protein [Sodalis sp. RH21]|uniref:YeiH family protein n=1 Tax=unclassified Sodalis (in: enterobacteria) TaxID=2636512 RepID=UPI0039B405BD